MCPVLYVSVYVHACLVLSHLALLHFPLLWLLDTNIWIFFFFRNCKFVVTASSRSVSTIFLTASVHFASLSQFGNSHSSSNISITIIFAMAICDLWCFCCSGLGAPWNTQHMFWLLPCPAPPTHLLLRPPYSLRHNNTDIRSVNNPMTASKCSRPRGVLCLSLQTKN